MARDLFERRSQELQDRSKQDVFEERNKYWETYNNTKTDIPLAVQTPVFDEEEKQRRQKIFSHELKKGRELIDRMTASPEALQLIQEASKQQLQRGFVPSIERGYQTGVSGIATGRPEPLTYEPTFTEKLGQQVGRIASDIPAMIPGGAAGSILGPIGAAAGAFSAPQLLNTAYDQYLDYVRKGNDLTFGEFLERAGQVGKETGKAAIVGGVTGFAGRLLPFLRMSPRLSKILDKPAGAALARGTLEVGGLSVGQRLTEGEWPSAEEFAQNAITIAGMHGAGKIAEKTGIAPVIRSVSNKTKEIIKDTAEHAAMFVPDELKGKFRQAQQTLSKLSPRQLFRISEKERPYFEMLKDFLGIRNARYMASQMKWAEHVDSLKHLPDEAWQDMIYYRQKTGNPNIKGDSYKKLVQRLSPEARNFVDTTVADHFKEMLKTWNEHPATQDINPREAVEEIYLPGLYEYDPQNYARAYDEYTKQFKKANPLKNPKKFMTYLEALEAKGLKPRYNNLVDLMQAYDRIMIKSMSNHELLNDIKKTEKATGQKLIVNSTNETEYNKAKGAGFVPFHDFFLRRHVVGMKDGKPQYAITAKPALVDPNFASAFKGVFNQRPYSPPNVWTQAYDSISDFIRFSRVALSGFHYGALTESAIGAMGPEALNFKKWLNEGAELRKNKEFMVDAAKHGLKVDSGAFVDYDKGRSWIDKALAGATQKIFGEGASKKLLRGMGYLFDHFHPRLKLVSWRRFVDKAIMDSINEGIPLAGQELTDVKRGMAELVNNMYGGQNWEIQKFFNDPNAVKFMRRLIGYPDWTISAAKQAADVFAPGLKGEASRNYWMKYAVGQLMFTAISRLINSGFEQTDPDKSPTGIRWNPTKAFEGLRVKDPKNWYKIPLPNIDVNIAGRQFRMGRDERGRRLYTHPGKQALEIGRYFMDPIKSIFSKSNPILQMVATQMFGGSPSLEGVYPAQLAYVSGQRRPWGGKEGLGQVGYRAKELAESMVPFSLKNISQQGILPVLATGATLPISKSMNLYDAEKYLETAFKKNDITQVNLIRSVLKDSGYKEGSIKATVTRARKKATK